VSAGVGLDRSGRAEPANVVEIKVTANADNRQARSLNIDGFTLVLDEHPCRLRWRDILGDLVTLLPRGQFEERPIALLRAGEVLCRLFVDRQPKNIAVL
jgi:hypothetical protein